MIVPTVALPPVMPLTFHTTAVFVAFCTVAVNCLVSFILTAALVGETVTVTGGFTTATFTGPDTPPSGFVTVTGTPLLVDEAVPVAVSFVAELKVVARAVPPNFTTAPLWKPVPFTVSVKLPTVSGEGLSEMMAGGGTTVTDALPIAVGSATLFACTLTVAGDGTAAGAV